MEIPPDAIHAPLPMVIDSDSFTPRLLSLLSNSLGWRESNALRMRFGLGTNDWCVIAGLGGRPGMTSTEISEFVAMNKAIVSKSVNVLAARRLIVQAEDSGRSRQLYLTAAGAEMHAAMFPISMRGQEILLADLTEEEVALLNQLLHRLLDRVPALQADALNEPVDLRRA